MKKSIMAIGGHVGDMELTCGGILSELSLLGYHIIVVSLTAGERGNPINQTVTEYRSQKVKEAAQFTDLLKGDSIVLPYSDGELPNNEEIRFRICDLIRTYRPQALLTHWKNSIHKDHEVTSQIVKDAQFYASLTSIERKDPPHFAKGPYYAQNWEDSQGFVPYIYAQITNQGFELWSRAIKTSWFAVNSPHFAYQEYYSLLMRLNGILIRGEYAEAFAIDDSSKHVIVKEF